MPGEAEGVQDVPAFQQQRGPLHQAPAGVLRVQPHDISLSGKCTFPGGRQPAASEPGEPSIHFHRPSGDTDIAQVCQPLSQHLKSSVLGGFSLAKNQKLKASSVPSAPPCWVGHCCLQGGQWLCQGSIPQANNCFSPCSPPSFQPCFLVQTSGSLPPLPASSKTVSWGNTSTPTHTQMAPKGIFQPNLQPELQTPVSKSLLISLSGCLPGFHTQLF